MIWNNDEVDGDNDDDEAEEEGMVTKVTQK